MPAPPYLRGDRDTEQAQLGHLREDAAIESVRAVQLADAGGHFASRPFADRLLEQTLLVGEIEVQHQRVAGGDEAGASAGFLNSTSRRLLLSRNCSVMRSSSNMRWMSRFGSGRCLPRAAAYGRC